MNDRENEIYKTVISLEALWKMNQEKTLIEILTDAASRSTNPPEDFALCGDQEIIEGLYNLIENRYAQMLGQPQVLVDNKYRK